MTVSLEEAQSRLAELLARLSPGEEVAIVKDGVQLGRLVGEPSAVHRRRVPGSAKGTLVIHEEDDEHLRDFADYMP